MAWMTSNTKCPDTVEMVRPEANVETADNLRETAYPQEENDGNYSAHVLNNLDQLSKIKKLLTDMRMQCCDLCRMNFKEK